MYATKPHCRYGRAPVVEVICQLRFPEILSISEKLPVDFQEAVRQLFPQYQRRQEIAPPKIVGTPGNFSLENPPPVINYQFASADSQWKINLTSKFISLTCTNYTGWEEFARKLDKPLAAFIQIYQPAYFERIGLRYLNMVSRKNLELEGVPFAQLIHPRYLGILSDPEIPEAASNRCTVDVETAIRGGCRLKLHAGPGLLKRNGVSDPEVKFVFDQDLYMPGQVNVNLSAGALQTLHAQAFSIFRGAVTDTLHEAMEPDC